jgi:hypothetical protein
VIADNFVRNMENYMVELTNRLRRGEITLAQWQSQQMAALKSLHLIMISLSQGGWQQMAPADYGRAGGILTREYRFLQDLATQISAEQVRLDGNIVRRTRLFARAGRNTYFRGIRDAAIKRGFDLERSILMPAEHCNQCVEEDLKGWQGIGEMVPIGERTCRRNCRCQFYFRRSSDGAEKGPF